MLRVTEGYPYVYPLRVELTKGNILESHEKAVLKL